MNKQIDEELAARICAGTGANYLYCIVVSDHLHRAGNRKIYENMVVIPEKVTEETSPEDIIKIAKYNEKVRKETVMEILKEFIDVFPKVKGLSSSHAKIHRFIDEIAKFLWLLWLVLSVWLIPTYEVKQNEEENKENKK